MLNTTPAKNRTSQDLDLGFPESPARCPLALASHALENTEFGNVWSAYRKRYARQKDDGRAPVGKRSVSLFVVMATEEVRVCDVGDTGSADQPKGERPFSVVRWL